MAYYNGDTPDPIREQSLERSLPNSPEAERAILGGIVLDEALIFEAITLLRPEDFYVPSHRKIFLAMTALFERGVEINPILIGEELRKENSLESVGGISYITNLTYGLPHSTNIAHYAKVVLGKAKLRQAIKEDNLSIQDALEQEDEPDVILQRRLGRALQITQDFNAQGLVKVSQRTSALVDDARRLSDDGAPPPGLMTGFSDVDRVLSGFQKQDLILLAARPSMGKTSFMLGCADNIATRDLEAVIPIFSLEMSRDALVIRALCSRARVDSQRYKNRFLRPDEWERLEEARRVLDNTRIFVNDDFSTNTLSMRAQCMAIQSRFKRLDLIMVDYLQLMSGSARRFESRQQEVSQISRELKGIAKDLNVPLVALCQLNRDPEGRADKRPQLADLRESGSLEQDADVVAFFFRECIYQRMAGQMVADPTLAEFIVAKNRNGPTGPVPLRYEETFTRFDNLVY